MAEKRKRLIFRGNLLADEGLNIHRVYLRTSLSMTVVYKYLSRPEHVNAVDLKVLPALLMDGLGMSKSEMMNLKLSDLFELVEDK